MGLTLQKNIVKSIIAVNIMDVGAILFLITVNYTPGNVPPVGAIAAGEVAADPLPQALMITAIVIGISVTAVSLAIFITLFRRYGSADWATVMKRAVDR
jgi:multicomponent Na+:H+ antiporter subunit C